MSDRASRLVVIGKVTGVYGVRGWVKVQSGTEPPEAILDYPAWQLRSNTEWRAAVLKEGRRHGKGVLAHFVDCDDRDVARTLIGAEIAVRRDAMPDPGPDQFYRVDLEGLRVHTQGGETLGVVASLMETGAHDVLVVKGERERLIPYVWGAVIKSVDLDRGVIEVDWDADF